MFVTKRDGRKENVVFDKITARIQKLCYGLDSIVATEIAVKVINGLYPGVSTVELDTLAAETAACRMIQHPNYGILAARLAISNHHKQTKKTFSDVMSDLYHCTYNGQHKPIISEKNYRFIVEHAKKIDSSIVYNRDFSFSYFGFKTLERSYLLKIDGKCVERPQHMYMRVAIGIHGEDIDSAIETYNYLSERYFIHATPTLFNAATLNPQLSSCFLVSMKEDSISGIFDTLKQCALISKTAGGIGLNVHCIRSTGSYISGSNGHSNGLVPMLRVFNNTARYVDQGGNKRAGSFAIYLEPWHADIFSFLELKKNTGKEEDRARDLFYGLWIPDLFMKRVEANSEWSLFDPNIAKGLDDVYGDEFEELYCRYETEKKQIKTVNAQELWYAILESQIETGTPYMLYKDSCNKKSNQQNLGTIKSSNLCTEIIQFSSPEEIAVCNLASLSLPAFLKDGVFDFTKLYNVTKTIVKNLNKIIDINQYPTIEAECSNKRHRPIGIGVQGLADLFCMMRFPFDSSDAKQLNKDIFEAIYFSALMASMELSIIHKPYETYNGSPISRGILQFDCWENVTLSQRWDWADLRAKIAIHGIRNSLLVAPMPTASTSQILGNNESFEPYTSNIYVRRVLAGEFQNVNTYLVNDLISLGLWNDTVKNQIIAHNGSIQAIPGIPQSIKELYKTVWEISQKTIIDMAADRGAFIDQSQSMNIYLADPSFAKLTSMHFYGWKKGLKTGMYYLRTRSTVDAIKFTVDQKILKESEIQCSLLNKEHCMMCGS